MLKKDFFNRSAVSVAEELLGKILCVGPTSLKLRGMNQKIKKFEIVETEAYEGLNDKASHASRGKTARNAPMFEEAGTIYVYFTYGMHYMLNVVCGPKGHPGAVLIRGLTSLQSKINNSPPLANARPLSYNKRGEEGKEINLIGPGRLTKYLKIDKSLNSLKLGKSSGLWIEYDTKNRGREKVYRKQKIKVIKTPRIGVAYAGEIWSNKKYRFVLQEPKTKN